MGARVGTVNRGTVEVLYVIQPDEQGRSGIDVELDRPMDPPCVSFHADALIRVLIANHSQDYPSQTLGTWPTDKFPPTHLADSDRADSKLDRLVLVRNNTTVTSDAI